MGVRFRVSYVEAVATWELNAGSRYRDKEPNKIKGILGIGTSMRTDSLSLKPLTLTYQIKSETEASNFHLYKDGPLLL